MVNSGSGAGDVSRRDGGVQSLHRALDLLEALVSRGGQSSLGALATASELPTPTAYRLMQTLVDRGYVRRLPDRSYALGYRLMPLGTAAGLLVSEGATSILGGLVAATGESANLAVLTGDHAEYVAQVPSEHSVRMFTEVGRKVDLHSTGVGKAMLAQLTDGQVRSIIRRVGLTAYTSHTQTTESGLLAELATIRENGYALDEQEHELGARCVAVPIRHPGSIWGAVSVSGPLVRMSDDVVARAVPLLKAAADELGRSGDP